MSSRKPSKRERKVEAVLDLLSQPPFFMWQKGPYFIVEKRPSPEFVPSAVPIDDFRSVERFDTEDLAKFARDWKNAEAIIDAINEIDRADLAHNQKETP